MWSNSELLVIFLYLKRLKMPSEPGQQYFQSAPGRFATVSTAQAPGIPADRLVKRFSQNLIAETLSNKGQKIRDPIPVQVVHCRELIVHALGQFLGRGLITGLDAGQNKIQRSLTKSFQFFVSKDSVPAHILPLHLSS